MDPTLKAFLISWDWRLDVIAVLLSFGILFTLGWFRLRHKGSQLAAPWRLGSYYAGLIVIAIALLSGFDTFQTQLFFIHMAQHLLLVMIAPPLLWWANPMPFLMWALPQKERHQIGRLLTQKSFLRRMLVSFTTPAIVWIVYSGNLWLWHDPNPYNAAIENEFLHDIEHVTFFGTAMVFWWHITNAAPKFHGRRPYAMRMGFIILNYFANLIVGVIITMSGSLIYTHYAKVPRIWGIDPLRDQTIGGLIMWIPGGMMYLMAFLVLLVRLVNYTEQQARLRDAKRRQLKLQELPST